MNVFPEEEPGANVLGSRQVAVVYLAVLESTQAVVVDLSAVFVVVDAVSVYLAGAVIGILRCTPCTRHGRYASRNGAPEGSHGSEHHSYATYGCVPGTSVHGLFLWS